LAGSVREGVVALGGAMLAVETDTAAVEERLRSGRLACPGCAAVLVGWGRAKLVERGEVPSGAPTLLLGFGGGLSWAAQVITSP